MKRFILFYVATFLACISRVSANVIYVEDVTIPQGEQQEIRVMYSFDKANVYVGYAFRLILPEGISTVKDAAGYPVYHLSENNSNFNMNVTASDGFGALPKNASVTIDGTEGLLMTLRLQANAELEIGSTHMVTINSAMLTEYAGDSQQSVYLEDVSFTVTIGEPTDKHIILDENSSTIPESKEDVDVRVCRIIKAGEWSSICLPFAMTEAQVKTAFGDDVLVADFAGTVPEFDDDNVTSIRVNFTDVQKIEANHPYIIKVSQPVSEFTVEGVDIVPDEDGACVEFDNGKTGSRRVVYSGFYGTYHSPTVLDEFTLFLSDNKFWYSTGLTKMKAFRAYFYFIDILTDIEDISNVKLWIDGDWETALSDQSDQSNRSDQIYNLAGQRVDKNYKGIVIEDGRKIRK